jgi:hypothetical protein
MTIDKQHHEGIISGRSYVIDHIFRGRLMVDIVGYFDKVISESYKNNPHFQYKAKTKFPYEYQNETESEGSEFVFNIGLVTNFTLVTSRNRSELCKSLNK